MNALAWTTGLLLAAAWLAPLHILPWMSWHNELLAAGAALLAAGAALWWHHGHRPGAKVLIPSAAALPLFVAAVTCIQWLAGQVAFGGSVWTIVGYALLCVAGLAVGHAAGSAPADSGPPKSLCVLAYVLLFVGLAQAFVVFSQTLGLWSGFEWIARTANETRGGGNVAQPNQAAHLFLLAMVASVYFWQLRRIGTTITVAVLIVFAAALATTESRSGMLAAALVLAWHAARRSALPRRTGLLPVVAMGATVLALFLAWPVFVEFYWLKGGEQINLTTSGRGEMWRQFASAVMLHPWVGWGVMDVAEAQNAIAHQHDLVLPATFSHNFLLDLALWMGLPAMLLVAAMIALWLWPRVRAARMLDTVACIALVLPFAVQAFTEFPYAYSYILVPVSFVLGVLDGRLRSTAGLRIPATAAAGLAAAWVLAGAWSAAEYVRIEEDFRVARFEALRMGSRPAEHAAPTVLFLTQLDALLHATRVKPRPGMPEGEMALLRDTAMLYPWGATQFRYATALALNGQMEAAHRQMRALRATQGAVAYNRLLEVLDDRSTEFPQLKALRTP